MHLIFHETGTITSNTTLMTTLEVSLAVREEIVNMQPRDQVHSNFKAWLLCLF